MIPTHEDLGHLVTTETEWYRPVYSYWEEEDKQAFQEEHGVAFCVVEQASEYGGCTWGFSKLRPLESLIAEYGNPIHREEKWNGKYLGLKFPKNEWLIDFQPYGDEEETKIIESLPLVVCNHGRCNGIANMEGDRCTGREYHGKFCATCKKYNDKVKAGKLRECKYCTSTYHSTQSCKQNPKVIAAEAEAEARLAEYMKERDL